MYDKEKNSNLKKLNRYMVDHQDGVVDFYPVCIQIEHTNRCNANCIMCNHFYTKNMNASEISIDIIKKIEPIMKYCQLIMLNGDGEPFLYSNIIECMKMYKKYGVKIGTNTNLCFIPPQLFEYLDVFEYLNVSCDGATKATFEMIRRGLSFEVFLSNLKAIKEKKPSLKLILDVVVMKQNINELPQLVELASDYGCIKVKFHRMGVNPWIGNQKDSPDLYMKTFRKKLHEAIKIAQERGILIEYPEGILNSDGLDKFPIPDQKTMYVEINERYYRLTQKMLKISLDSDYLTQKVCDEDFEKLHSVDKLCSWALERCFIDIHGNVSTCCYNTRKYMGNLKQKTFDEIWNGKEYLLFRENLLKYKLPHWCESCNWIKDTN